MTERQRLEKELQEITKKLANAGDNRQWGLCEQLEKQQELIREQLGRTKKVARDATMPDFFVALGESVSGDTKDKRIVRDVEQLNQDLTALLVRRVAPDLLEELVCNNDARLTITADSPADSSGRDIRLTVELVFRGENRTQARAVSKGTIDKRSVSR